MEATPTPGELLIAELVAPNATIVARLAKAVNTPFEGPVGLANIVEADFVGYAPLEITDWEDVSVDGEDLVQVLSPELTFTAEAGVTPQQVVAVYVTCDDGVNPPKLFSLDPLESPYIFSAPGDTLLRQVRVASTGV